MAQNVSIGTISTRRTLEPEDDISDLAEHIRDSGLQIPVLVNQNYELIDGLRRIEAVRSLGNTTIDVVPVTLFGPAVTWLERARVHGVHARPLSPRRIWEMYRAVVPLISLSRSQQMRGSSHGRGVHVDGRERFRKATGIESESYFQAVTQLYRMAREDDVRGDIAREAVELVERGQLSIYMSLDYVRRRVTAPGNIIKADQQLPMFDNIVSTLAGISYSLSQLGPIDQSIPREKLTDIATELRSFRRTLFQLINQLEKEQDSR